jgi:hypothetical protein
MYSFIPNVFQQYIQTILKPLISLSRKYKVTVNHEVSLCDITHLPITSSFVGQNVFLNTSVFSHIQLQ